MLLTLAQMKKQLKLEEDDSEEDEFLELIGRGVQSRTQTYLNRNLYPAGGTVPDSDPDGLILPDDVLLGMLMLVTHLYENRSASTDIESIETPMAFTWLVGPYRFIPL